jgi:hypothetical protein
MSSSLQFLLQAMQALRRKNPLTESFLVQLDLDLESAGIPGLGKKPYLPPTNQVSNPQHTESEVSQRVVGLRIVSKQVC